jgi:small neutral amino acid transporter SnatA (MarC family)
MELFLNILFIVVGLFVLLVSIMNWDWFFTSTKAQRLISLIGRTGTRIFYAVVALLLILFGIGSITGFLK